MKKIMSLMLGMSLVLGAASFALADDTAKTSTKKPGKTKTKKPAKTKTDTTKS